MKLTLDRSGLLVASIPGVTTLPDLPTLDLDAAAIDADYRKRIVDVVLEFRARQAAKAPHDDGT
jgi:hypothetical protein